MGCGCKGGNKSTTTVKQVVKKTMPPEVKRDDITKRKIVVKRPL